MLAIANLAADTGPPVELGRVRWERDYARAEAAAKANGRPLLTLFQEVPG
ncbi:MAG: hypothetical protein ACKVX7_12890 [Planctomycetota bacterium]